MITGAVLFTIGILLLYWGVNAYRKAALKPKPEAVIFNEKQVAGILDRKVDFYKELSPENQQVFVERVLFFLSKIRITPVNNAAVNDEDRVLVAAAGVIPLFHYKNWFYNNLNEVLVYPEAFNKEYELEGDQRTIIGMVGDGPMHRTMILSLPFLRSGFSRNAGSNTAIHEFAHLLDKSDGAIDGIPELILQDANIKPWVHYMHEYIREIRKGKDKDIDPYGATNEAEFFAVLSEYFFQKPEKLKEKHPELYKILEDAFDNKNG